MTERRVLVIDTATHAVVTGLARVTESGADEVSSRVVADERRHAETLTTLMADSLREAGWAGADLDAVVVGCGPGPFTGLRVGMATAAAYGDALGIPVYGVCSLDAIAAVAVRESGTRSVLVVTDARRREVYWARFLDGECVAGPGVIAPAVLVDELAGEQIDLVAGVPALLSGGRVPGEALAELGVSISRDCGPDVVSLATIAADAVLAGAEPDPLLPLYLRRPDAVELADQKKKRARA